MKYDKSIEIQYIIKNLEFDIQFDNDFFSNKDKKQIKNTLDMITKTIYIDKIHIPEYSRAYSKVEELLNFLPKEDFPNEKNSCNRTRTCSSCCPAC